MDGQIETDTYIIGKESHEAAFKQLMCNLAFGIQPFKKVTIEHI